MAALTIGLTPPTNGTGACKQNVYSLAFNATTPVQILIDASLSVSNPSCTTVSEIFLKDLNASAGITAITSLDNGKKLRFDATGNVTITYSAFINCSVLPATGAFPSINLVQTFTDVLSGGNIITINGGAGSSNNTFTATNIGIPFLADITLLANLKVKYNTPSYLFFYYKNSGNTELDMQFTFTKDASEFCNRITTDAIQYAIGLNGVYSNTGSNIPLVLGVDDTLVIRQAVHTNLCITEPSLCGTVTANLSWHCNNSGTGSNFCNSCLNGYDTEYSINDGDVPSFLVERILPADPLYDFSCLNSTLTP